MEEDTTINLEIENLLSPFSYGLETPLPKTLPEVPGGMYLSGFISQDCTWGCSFNRSVIQCFPVQRYFEEAHSSFASHSSLSSIAVSSSSYSFPPTTRIACATELAIHNPKITSGTRKLLLGLSCQVGDNNNKDLKGAVVLFDPIRCLPMKWIEIPEPVSCITTLSHFEEGGSSRPFFNETMMAMCGIAAIGLRGGTVLIVDLGLDDPTLTAVTTNRNPLGSLLTYRLLYVTAHEYVIATKRHKAVLQRNLIALKFTNEPEDDTNEECFNFCKPNGESIKECPKIGVAVTCIEYVPAMGALLVGFTCGGFQIIRINNMQLIHSSDLFYPSHYTIQRCEVPVFGFTFQQPVDDIRNFCYVWVMYGNKSAECIITHLELYQLLYEKRDAVDNFGYVYDGLKSCQKRMSFPLIDDFCPEDSDSEDIDLLKRSSRPVRIWSQPETELMYCVWEVGRAGTYYVGAFDLNQWYSNRTLGIIFTNDRNGLCPYWTAIPVELEDASKFVLDVRITPKSLMRWENPHVKHEVHMYPASNSFRAVCLTNSGVAGFEHFGIQEKLIRIFLKEGATLMIAPETIKNAFERYGLEPVFQQAYEDHIPREEQERFYILSVLLESRRTPAIVRLAQNWLDGSYANVGCTIDLIIDWIIKYMLALRGAADEHWDTLFEISDRMVPPETVRFINFSNFAWTSLHRLLSNIMGPAEDITLRRQELESISYGLGKLVQYSAALLMMYKAQLLPDCDGTFIKSLTSVYEQRRIESKNAIESSNYIDGEYKKAHPLMIDYLLDSLMASEDVREQWHVEEDEYCYPPQHVGYLLNMFMWYDAEPRAVSRVFMYFLIDLSFYSQNGDDTQLSNIERKVRGDFKAVMESNGEEYQDIYALWALDHGEPGDILVHLKENDRLYQNDGLPWCAAVVALTAIGYENDVAELLSKSCPHNLAKLLFSLMTSSSSKYAALADLMLSSSLSFDEDLLKEFFQKLVIRNDSDQKPLQPIVYYGRFDDKQKQLCPINTAPEVQAIIFDKESLCGKRFSICDCHPNSIPLSESRERLSEFISTKAKVLPDRVKIALLRFLNDNESVRRLSLLLSYYIHTEDYSKLEEEFHRIGDLLSYKKLSDADRKLWSFQKNYLDHVLAVAKGSRVLQFLRRQSPLCVRQALPTINVKAVLDRETTPPRLEPGRIEPKLPPHLRRLKLNETLAQDPLSPLRRYAGRIQRAVAPNCSTVEQPADGQDNQAIRPQPRKSMRTSISFMRQSFMNSSTLSERLRDSDDRLNITSRSITIDIPNLLKTPAVDHRFDKSRLSVTSFNVTSDRQLGEDSVNSEPQIHSIMKESDPNKPRTTKKMELRFQNMSLSSSEEDEKNQTIYEDAEDVNVSTDSGNTGFEQSYSSATGSFLAGDPVENEKITIFEENISDNDDINVENRPKDVEKAVDESKWAIDETMQENIPETDLPSGFEDSNIMIAGDGDGEEEQSKLEVSSATSEKDVSKTDENPPEEMPEPRRSLRASRSRTPTREADVNEEAKNILDEGRTRRSSRSGTPKADTPAANTSPIKTETVAASTESDEVVEKKRKRSRTSRSRTPTREVTEEVNVLPNITEESAPAEHSIRAATPKRDALADLTPERSPSRATTIQAELNADEESVPTTRKRSRVSRSRTPTREVILDPVPDPIVPEDETVRRSTRSTRSMTPSREAPVPAEVPAPQASTGQEENNEDDEVATSKKRKRSRVSRSRTPTREVAPEVDVLSTISEVVMSTRMSTRSTTPSRETSAMNVSPERPASRSSLEGTNEEQEVPTKRKKRSRVSRSRTPTREVVPEVEVLPDIPEEKVVTRSSARSSLNPEVPAEDISIQFDESHDSAQKEEENEDDGIAARTKRRSRVSRSRTPSRDVVPEVHISNIPEERMQTRSSRRSSQSMTPTREFQVTSVTPEQPVRSSSKSQEDPRDDIETPENTRKRSRVSKSRTPTRDVVADVSVIPNSPESGIVTRSSARSSRSNTPHRELVFGGATPERPASRSSLSRTSTIQDDSREDEDAGKRRRSSRVSRSRTPTRDMVPEIHANPSVEDEGTVTRKSTRSTRSTTPSRDIAISPDRPVVDTSAEGTQEEQKVAPKPKKRTRDTRSKTPTREVAPEPNVDVLTSIPEDAEVTLVEGEGHSTTMQDDSQQEEGIATRTRRKRRVSRSKTPTRESVTELATVPEDKILTRASSVSSRSTTPGRDIPSSGFEVTQEDLEDDDEEEEVDEGPSTSQKAPKLSSARKRRLKYLNHEQELSTVVEETSRVDSTLPDVSLFENTIMPPKPDESKEEPPKAKKIKGIKSRPAEEPSEDEQPKPSKRRKAASVMDDLDLDDDDDDDAASVVSTRSNASRASKSKTSKTTRKRGRPKKKT